jgi:hypothetical protein
MPEIGNVKEFLPVSKLSKKSPNWGTKSAFLDLDSYVLASVSFCRGDPPIVPGNWRQLSPKAAAPSFSAGFLTSSSFVFV